MDEAYKMKAKWNYEPAEAWRGTVIVGKAMAPTWWCAKLEGARRKCVRVKSWSEDFFYLDDEDGSGSRKVFEQGGGPDSYSAHIPVDDHATFEVDTNMSNDPSSAKARL